MKKLFTFLLVCLSFWASAQVGINNTDPKASLDITASNVATPSNTDGILIPRVDDFPLVNPTADQDGMMVFATGAGTPSKGFYYWDNALSAWVTVKGASDDDWYEEGTTTAPDNINDDIFTQGNVAIGKNIATYNLDVESTGTRGVNTLITGSSGSVVYGHFIENNSTGAGDHYATHNRLSGTASGGQYGSYQDINNTGNGVHYGSYNRLTGTGTGIQTGSRQTITNTGDGSHTGSHNELSGTGTGPHTATLNFLSGTGSGVQYGSQQTISNSGNGTHYGSVNTLSGTGSGTQYGSRQDITNSGDAVHYGSYNRLAGTGTGLQYGSYQSISNSGDGIHYGLYSILSGTATGDQIGSRQEINNTGSGNHYGSYNRLTSTGTGNQYGSWQQITNSGNANHYGTYNFISGAGTGNKYGMYSSINNAAGGTHYGVYSDARKATGYAGYFIGRMSLGNTTSNRYLMPASDGTANYIMQTNGSGQVSFVNPTTVGTDDQTIDTFSFNSGTNVLTLEVENDGIIAQTVDLSSLADVSSNNGLNTDAGIVQLGGPLTEATTVTLGTNNLIFDINVGGDFRVNNQNAPINGTQFTVDSNGATSFGGQVQWFDGNTSGDVLATLSASGNDGFFRLYENGLETVSLETNTGYIFNELGYDRNFRIESNNRGSMLFVDGGQDRVGIGTGAPSNTLHVVGDAKITSLAGTNSRLVTSNATGVLNNITDGTNGQLLTTNGVGAYSWLNSSSVGTDDQTIDNFNFNTGTNILTLEVENDGVAPQTVDLSSLNTSDADWFEEGTTTAPNNINDDIFTQGNVAIGKNTADYNLDIESTGTRAINTLVSGSTSGDTYGQYIENTNTGNDSHFGIFNHLDGTGNGARLGTYNSVEGTGNGVQYGTLNELSGSGSGDQAASRQHISNSGDGDHFGSRNFLEGSGSGDKFGFFSNIDGLAGGIHYGVYSDARKGTGYAGFFIGRVSLGITSSNRYLMPAIDGGPNYIMQTNGAGQVSFVNPTTVGTDNQTIDTFSFDDVTNILTLEVENDGVVPQTVDLSSINTSDADWFEEGTTTAPNSINDDIFTQGNVAIGKNTASSKLEILNNDSTITPFIAKFEDTSTGSGDHTGLEVKMNGSHNEKISGISSIITNSGNAAHTGFLTELTNSTFNKTGMRVVITGNKSDIGVTTSLLDSGLSSSDLNRSISNYIGQPTSFGSIGVQNSLGAEGANATGYKYATQNTIIGGSGTHIGTRNQLFSDGSGIKYGVFNKFGSIAYQTEGVLYGTYNAFDVNLTSTTSKYGTYTIIPSSLSGTHYGTYNNVQNATGYAGYFIGRMSLGNTTSNRYLMPAADGTANYIMQTNGSGQVSFVDPATIGDADWFEEGTTTAPNSINDDIFTQGHVAIGKNIAEYALDVEETGAFIKAVNVSKTDNTTVLTYGLFLEKTSNGTGQSRGIHLDLDGSSNNTITGLNTVFSSTLGNGGKIGVLNSMPNSAGVSGDRTAIKNIFPVSPTGISQYGMHNEFASSAQGSLYGVYNDFDTLDTFTNTQYGFYNHFQNSINNPKYGSYSIFDAQAGGAIRGHYVEINAEGSTGSRKAFDAKFGANALGTIIGLDVDMNTTGTQTKYGVRVNAVPATGIQNYGIHSTIQDADGWAGYFVGKNYISNRLSINETDNPNTKLNILMNSGSTTHHIELNENDGNDGARIRFTNNVETTNNWLLYGRADNTSADSRFNIAHNGTGNILHIRGDGRVGINDGNPTYALELPDNTTISVGRARANAWITYSDGRIKKDQRTIKYGLKDLLKIQPKSYTQFTSNFDTKKLTLVPNSGTEEIGFIAQELYDIIPEAAFKPKNEEEDLWSVDYEKIIPVAVQAIKELNTKVETLEKENQELKQQLSIIEILEARLTALEDKNNTTNSDLISEKK